MFRLALVYSLALVAIASVHAQTPPNPVQLPEAVPPIVPAVPPAPAVTPQVPQIVPPAPPIQPGQDGVQLRFGASSQVTELLDIYASLTEHRLLTDNIPLPNVPLFINERVPPDEAIKIIRIALMMNGIALLPTDDPRIWKVSGPTSNPKQLGVPLYSDIDLVPENEQLVSFYFKLRYADPAELAPVLMSVFPGSKALAGGAAGASMVPLPKSQAILVTDNTPIIRQMYRLLTQIDLPPAEVVTQFFKLERADAEDVQKKLEDILTKQAQGQSTTTVTTPAGQVPVRRLLTTPEGLPLPEGAPLEEAATTVEITATAGPNEENIIQGKVKITADIRTNRILIVTRPENMKFISDLIEQFDANSPFGEPSIRTLRHVNAADIFQVVVKSIAEPGQDAAAGGGTPAGNRTGQQASSQTGLTGNLFDNNRNSNDGFGNSGGGGGGGSQTFSESLSAEERDTTPDTVRVGTTIITADKRNNAIIVQGSPDAKEKVFGVIDLLDVRAPQVLLVTCIGQLTLDENETFGVDYILKNAGRFENIQGAAVGTGGGNAEAGVIGFNATSGSPQLNLSALLNQRRIRQIGTAGAGGLSGFFTAGNALDVIVTALSATNKFKVVSSPRLYASNNKKAVISSGSEIAIPTNIQSGFSGGATNGLVTNSSIQYKTVALQTEILPLINSKREVTLDIVQKVDEQNGFDVIDGNRIPRIATRVLKTTVTVPNRATLILGGLIKQSKTDGRTGIPILSKIPLIGPLFRTTTKVDSREELIILIRPEVTIEPGESIAVREKEQEFFRIESDLESTLIPKGVRVHAPAEELMRKPAPPGLREHSARPAFNIR